MKQFQYLLALSAACFSAPMGARDCERECFKSVLCDIRNEVEEIEDALAAANACGTTIAIGQADLPYTIYQSGQRYCLKEDVTFNLSGPAVTVASGVHDVTFDMNLHTIQLTQPVSNAISVNPDTRNVTLANGSIQGNIVIAPPIHPGIPVYPSGPSVIYGPNQNGIIVDTTDEINITNIQTGTVNIGLIAFTSNNVNIDHYVSRHCVFGLAINSLDSNAAFIVPMHDWRVANSEFSDQAEFGIYLNAARFTNVVFSNINIVNNQSDGIFFDQGGESSNYLFENVRCSNNQGNGLHTQLYTDHLIFNNCQFNGNLRNGLGIIGTRNCTINDCQAINNGLSGIAFLTRASDNVELNNCKVVTTGLTGNGGEIPLRFDMVRNLLINNCQVYSYNLPTIPNCTPETCAFTNFPAVRIQQCFNVEMNNSLVTMDFTNPENPANGIVIRSSEGVQLNNVGVDFGYVGALTTNMTDIQANGFLVRGGVSNCRLKDCFASGRPNNGFAVVWDNDNGTPVWDSFSGGITFENCKAVGARNAGFYINLPSEDALRLGGAVLLGNEATHNAVGIQLTNGTTNCVLRDNTMLSNTTYGLLDQNAATPDNSNAIFHNFAADNATANFSANVKFVVLPALGLGSIENISGY